ncbi:MAG: hypothetical protein L3J54_11440, partial [Draconibacterium sp.]|nr:hypothetical protein [Draconibacterium sp.]
MRKTIAISSKINSEIVSETADGYLNESFIPEMESYRSSYIYNIGSSACMMEYDVSYGGGESFAPKVLGAKRWLFSYADYIFSDPPDQIKTSRTSGE